MPIDIEKLKAVKTLITHENCTDGLATAMIVLDALPRVEIVFVQHNTEAYLNLPATENMLFCDIVPPPARVQEFVDKGAIVLDHHKSAKAVVEAFGTNGTFADEGVDLGVSGAVLAYREVWLPFLPVRYRGTVYFNRVGHFATLVGIRDTWQKKDPRWEEAKKLHLILDFIPKEQWLSGDVFCKDQTWATRMALGDVLLAQEKRRVDKTIEGAYRFTSAKGLKVCLFQGIYTTSDAAEQLGSEVDVVLGWGYKVEIPSDVSTWPQDPKAPGPKLVVSCRSHSDFNVATFASLHGGGGHTKAAGFSSLVQAGDPNPYEFIRKLIEGYNP